MHKWKEEFGKYLEDLFSTQPFSMTIQIMITVSISVFLLDYYDIPSIALKALPQPVLLVIAVGLVLLILSWIIGTHIFDLAKMCAFNTIDISMFILLIVVPVWFLLQTWMVSFKAYKFIICISCTVLCLGVFLYRIRVRCNQKKHFR